MGIEIQGGSVSWQKESTTGAPSRSYTGGLAYKS